MIYSLLSFMASLSAFSVPGTFIKILLNIKETFPGPCTAGILNQDYRVVIHQPNKGILITCNEKSRVYVENPSYTESPYGEIWFASYICRSNKWVNQDLHHRDKKMHCTKGCPNIPRNSYLHVKSSPETCTLLNDPDDTLNPPAYAKCEIFCEEGYSAVSNAENQLNRQEVYCKNLFGASYWEINTGFDSEPFVNCVSGCALYGSYKNQDTYGMLANFMSVGVIDGMPRYSTGDLKCDTKNGFFPKSSVLKPSASVSCEGGMHWIPPQLPFYCIKGCRKPGGAFGTPPIRGFSFSCSDGSEGWHLLCSFTCDQNNGYVMVGRKGRLLSGAQVERIQCINGQFEMSKTQNVCKIRCHPPTKTCDSGFTCTGIIHSHEGKDTGKRYCVKANESISSFQTFKEQVQSQVGALMVETFGSYEWLL